MAGARTPRLATSRWMRLTVSARFCWVGCAFAALSLLLFIVRTVVPPANLSVPALAAVSVGAVFGWLAVLTGRMPVLPTRTLLGLVILWCISLAAAALLIVASLQTPGTAVWAGAVQSFALSLSLLSATLLFRSVLHRRRRLLFVRLLSLLSPIGIVVLLIVLTNTRG